MSEEKNSGQGQAGTPRKASQASAPVSSASGSPNDRKKDKDKDKEEDKDKQTVADSCTMRKGCCGSLFSGNSPGLTPEFSDKPA